MAAARLELWLARRQDRLVDGEPAPGPLLAPEDVTQVLER
jgi:hypothetical protein